ncbi:MAG: pyruvate, phosphate dikinase, partial [Acidimicrobiales bacterium]|nr:pyruvate, phosphate dikinase [Acidimicrobiales bacterium]
MTKWVYNYDEVDQAEAAVDGSWDAVRGLLGGKGANLGDMHRIGVPVPPGFTISTQACNEYLKRDQSFPADLLDQVRTALERIEAQTGKSFGSPTNPLLVSCRSGAKFSMPGMMDTVLNIGMNDDVVDGMLDIFNDAHFVYDSYRRLIQMFATVVMGVREEPFEDALAHARERRGVLDDSDLDVDDLKSIVDQFKDHVRTFAGREFPDDPSEQLRMAIEAVFRSWNGKRAYDYRNAAGIAHDLGTGVNVQTMVFGNMGGDSATGVAMSRNATTGEKHLEGDFLYHAQGEDVVAGNRRTDSIDLLGETMPEVFKEFSDIATLLENHYRDMQDMEFTVEQGKLWVLQTRDGKRTAQAAVRIAVDLADEGVIAQEEALLRVEPDHVDFFMHPQFASDAMREAEAQGNLLASGLNVSPGAAVGRVAFDPDLAQRWSEEGKAVILARPETKP